MHKAAYAIGSTLVTYGMLTITLAVLLRRVGVGHAWCVTAAAVALLAASIEALQATTATRSADLTTVTLAIAAAVVAYRIYLAVVRLFNL
jgi:hypothetical protein